MAQTPLLRFVVDVRTLQLVVHCVEGGRGAAFACTCVAVCRRRLAAICARDSATFQQPDQELAAVLEEPSS